MATHFEKPAYYPHSMPEHGSEIVDKGKWQPSKEPEVVKERKRRGVVYERQRSGGKEGEGPERLMTPKEVIDTLQLPPSTVWTWVATGKLRERGRLWNANPGGRSRPIVSLDEAEALKNSRPRMGRPRKRRRGKG
jgi:hypothetical protein